MWCVLLVSRVDVEHGEIAGWSEWGSNLSDIRLTSSHTGCQTINSLYYVKGWTLDKLYLYFNSKTMQGFEKQYIVAMTD